MAGYYDRDRNPRSTSSGLPTTDPIAAGTMNHAYAHHSSVAEYQSSGIPFVATKTGLNANSQAVDVDINLPYVSRWIMINVFKTGTGAGQGPSAGFINNATISFGTNGDSNGAKVSSYLCGRQRLELKCKKIIVTIPNIGVSDCTVEIIAGLTSVKDFPSQDIANVSGITSTTTDGLDSSGSAITFNVFS